MIKMIDLRCEECNKLLAKQLKEVENNVLEIKCNRCNTINIFER